ncbi:PucR family transcriptional regulator [Nocardia inohanensis]|uniref:PucR family transcriptional regulator n=1 Tax=Nocardia inohanensis TaxID=209246 RepID=UPI00082A6012|nr:helix-turn-helix domain-containing protein [Nocardia inohanensis]
MRLSALGSDPASVLRLIGYFDRLDESAADPGTVIRGAAVLAECPVTATWPNGTVIRYDAGGEPMPRPVRRTPGSPRIGSPSRTTAQRDTNATGGPIPGKDAQAHAASGTEPLSRTELGPRKVRVTDIEPGLTDTERDNSGGESRSRTGSRSRADVEAGSCDPGTRAESRTAPETVGEPRVWLERCGGEHPLDAVLLDRLRHCLRVLAARQAADGPLGLGDPALLEVVLSEKERCEDRARAMRLLGLDQAREVRVLAVTGPCAQDAVRMVAERVPVCRVAVIGEITAVLTQDWLDGRAFSDTVNAAIAEAFPASRSGGGGPWMGIGARVPAPAAPTSWDQACRALRFACSTWHGRRAVAFDRLGSLELLADLPVERLLATPDVLRLNEFAATESGALAVDTLEAFCVYGSLRRTATELHLHHSTVAARIAQVETLMGWDIDEALDRFLATLVLTVRRIALSSSELERLAITTPGRGHQAVP